MTSNPLKVFPSYRLIVFLSICLTVLNLSSCKRIDIGNDIKIEIDLNIFKTFVSFRFADAQTGELIGKTDGSIVKLSFGGRDAAAVVTQTGERLPVHESVLGMISVALDPYEPYKMMPGKAVVFNFNASAPGYSTVKAAITISATGTQVCMVSMRKTGTSGSGPQVFVLKPGEVTGGYLGEGFRMFTNSNLFELDFPDSVQLAGANSEPASGYLTVTATRYNKLSESAAGSNRVMKFNTGGSIRPGVLMAQSIIDLTLQCPSGIIAKLPVKPVTCRFPVINSLQPGDSFPMWTFETVNKVWEPAGYALIIQEDTIRFATMKLNHFSLYAAGEVIPTRQATGEIRFAFARPFNGPSFAGNILISDASTGERIQTIPVTLFAGLTVPLTLDLPSGTSMTVSVETANSDYDFSSLPASLTITPDQQNFSVSFNLTPLKCRLSGTVKATFPAGFNAFPVPALLQVLDATTGASLLSFSISLSSTVTSTDLSLMVRDNRPVTIRIVPASLTGDFMSTPAFIREESPCLENGSWNFNLDSNTCAAHASISVTISGKMPAEPVPAEIQMLRASDRRLIKKMAVSLSQANTAINFDAAVPKNTPVILLVRPGYANRPFISLPSEFRWESPCTTSPNPVFSITPGYAQLAGNILFTFDPGLTLDVVPIRILTYTHHNDSLLSTTDYLVKKTDPIIRIKQFTPDEPLYIKIARTFNYIRFSPVPFKIDIPDPSAAPENWPVTLYPTELSLVHFNVKVVCPKGEVLPTVQGYYRIPGDDWHEMNIVSGSLTINLELGLTYEVGMILSGVMIDSTFAVHAAENDLTFPLEPADCEKMGWGK